MLAIILVTSGACIDLLQIITTALNFIPFAGQVMSVGAGFLIDIAFVCAIFMLLYFTNNLKSSTVLAVLIFSLFELIPVLQVFPCWTLAMSGLIRVINNGIAGLPLGGAAMQLVGYGQKAGVIGKEGQLQTPKIGDLAKKATGRQLPLLDTKNPRKIPPPLPQTNARSTPPPLPTRNRSVPPPLPNPVRQGNTPPPLPKTPPPLPTQNRAVPPPLPSTQEQGQPQQIVPDKPNTLTLQPKSQPTPPNYLNLNKNQAAIRPTPTSGRFTSSYSSDLRLILENPSLTTFERWDALKKFEFSLKMESVKVRNELLYPHSTQEMQMYQEKLKELQSLLTSTNQFIQGINRNIRAAA